jgi:RnfABCDGE-type electron transport complex B subunit
MLAIAIAAAIMLIIAIAMAWILGWANVTFHVEVDPRIDAINVALPGANCGGCGYVGCNDYAEAVCNDGAAPNLCPVGGESCTNALCEIMGVTVDQSLPYRPVVHCGATTDKRKKHSDYQGEMTCSAANVLGGVQGCAYGCLGLSDCVRSCEYDAIHVVNGLSVVDYSKCIGCGACARTCPRNIIHMLPFKQKMMMVVACSNRDPGKYVREVCEVGCIGCQGCARKSEDFAMESDLAHIDYEKYDPENMEAAQLALDKCPMQTIVYVGSPSTEDISDVKDEKLEDIVKDEFETTVDDTSWRG